MVASVDVVVVSEVKSVGAVSKSGTVVTTVGMVGSGGNVDGSVASAVVSGTSVGSSVGLSVGSSVGFSVGSSQVWSLTQFYSVDFSKSKIGVNSAFSTNAQSRFASVVVDGVPGPLRLARHT